MSDSWRVGLCGWVGVSENCKLVSDMKTLSGFGVLAWCLMGAQFGLRALSLRAFGALLGRLCGFRFLPIPLKALGVEARIDCRA